MNRFGERQRKRVLGAGMTRAMLIVASAVALGACNTSGALRGVGAQPEQQPVSEIALEPTTIEPAPSALAAIEQNAPIEDAAADGQPNALAPVDATSGQTAKVSDPRLYQGVELNIANENSTTPLALVQEEIPPAPEMATDRNEAIQQIRAKSRDASDIPTNIFAVRGSAVPKLTAEQQKQKTAEMKAAAERNATLLSEDEAKRRAADVKDMSKLANRHYREALQRIEAPERAAEIEEE